MPCNFLQNHHLVKGLDPVADALAGTVYSDVINMADYAGATFIIYKGVGTTGTSTITVNACDDISASNETAITFRYKAITATDVEGALTAAAVAGFTTGAGSSEIYAIEIDSEELGDTGYQYARLKAVESANDPVLAGILIVMSGGRYKQDVPATAVV